MAEIAAQSRRRSRSTRERPAPRHPLAGRPFHRAENKFPPLEPLSADQLEEIHQASLSILEATGIDFFDDEALELWSAAGAEVDFASRHVHIDRSLLLELVSLAPDSFELRARNPERTLTIGGNSINFVTVGGTPFYADLDTGRRPGRLDDFDRMVRLAHESPPIHIVEGLMIEPQDVPVPVRHLEKGLLQFTLTDKAITTAAHGREVAQDYVSMAAIIYGGLDEIGRQPVFASIINANSPLRYDERMLGGLITFARYGQATVITPFILAGAMSPVTLAAAIAQQNAEALAGIALTQLVRPGAPVVYGGFTTNLDMQSGSPAFGTPEGALAMLCGGQLARKYGLPYRGSGGLNNSKLVDAQASYETQMSLWPAVMAHSNIVMHAAGWLDAGLVCSLEKFIVDVEGLMVMQRMLAGVTIDNGELALDSIAEVGPGGHHLGTAHTIERYRTAFHLPVISDRQNYEKWNLDGRLDTAARAHAVARKVLAGYERPPLDEATREELMAFVNQRREEL